MFRIFLRKLRLFLAPVLMLGVLAPSLQAQSLEFKYGGYLKELGLVSTGNAFKTVHYDNILHNRIETEWKYGRTWELNVDLRNRLLNGFTVENQPGYDRSLDHDPGYADLSWLPVNTDRSILHSQIDRLKLSYFNGPWEAHFGRQRLNWARTFVWSPNDLFNNFSYLNFDYEERPGSDAFNLQYNWSYASSAELAWQFGHTWDETVLAGMLRGSIGSYDVQGILAHYYKSLALGAGWAGYIGDAGLKGEVTYFHPEDHFTGESGTLTASAGIDYMFNSGLYLRSELLYNGGYQPALNPAQQLTRPPSADNLFIARSGYFLDASYSFHPLVDGNFSIIGSFDRSVFVAIPQVSYSISGNTDLLLLAQFYKGSVLENATPTPNLFYVRLKWSF